MLTNQCPDRETLSRLLLGKLDGELASTYENHLLDCKSCEAIAETIDTSDEITSACVADESVHDTNADEKVLTDAIERAIRLRPRAHANSSGNLNTSGAASSIGSTSFTPDISFLSPPQSTDELGRLGGFRILETIGIGGMGIVFRAEDPDLGRNVAIKAMKPVVALSEPARQRFLREAKAAASIVHDNVVTIHHVGEANGIPFFAMQLLNGETLKGYLNRNGSLPQAKVIEFGHQMALGLEAAHQQGLIHRDIKPENIWIEKDTERVKILDFGLVRSVSDQADLTHGGVVLGTPKYMSPEQAQGNNVDQRSDLYSLGGVLYHALSGKTAFDGTDFTSILMAITQKTPAPIESLCPELHPDLATLVMRLLNRDRDKRPESAELIAEELLRLQNSPLDDVNSGQPKPQRAIQKRFRLLGAGAPVWLGAMLLLSLGVIIIKIKNKDGTTTEIKVPSESVDQVTIDLSNANDGPAAVPAVGVEHGNAKLTPLAPPAPIDSTELRSIAQWVLDTGYKLRVTTEQEPARTKVTELPAGPFQIETIDLSNRQISDDDVMRLRGLPNLNRLAIYGGKNFTDQGMQAIGSFTRLKHLYIKLDETSPVSGSRIDQLASMQELEVLSLGFPKMTDDEFQSFPTLSKLENLGLRAPEVSAHGIGVLGKLPNLIYFRIEEGGRISDSGISQFGKLKSLYELGVFDSRISSGDWLAELNGSKLRCLMLPDSQLSDQALSHLENLRLGRLVLDGSKISDRGVEFLETQSDLGTLSLSDTRITDSALSSIGKLKKLKHLLLNHTNITDKGAVTLGQMKSLVGLQVVGTNLSDASIEHLAKLENLKGIYMDQTQVTEKGVLRLREMLPNCRVRYTNASGELSFGK